MIIANMIFQVAFKYLFLIQLEQEEVKNINNKFNQDYKKKTFYHFCCCCC